MPRAQPRAPSMHNEPGSCTELPECIGVGRVLPACTGAKESTRSPVGAAGSQHAPDSIPSSQHAPGCGPAHAAPDRLRGCWESPPACPGACWENPEHRHGRPRRRGRGCVGPAPLSPIAASTVTSWGPALAPPTPTPPSCLGRGGPRISPRPHSASASTAQKIKYF